MKKAIRWIAGWEFQGSRCGWQLEKTNEQDETKKLNYLPGWDEAGIRKLADYYDNQNDHEAVAEIEDADMEMRMLLPEKLDAILDGLVAGLAKSFPAMSRKTS